MIAEVVPNVVATIIVPGSGKIPPTFKLGVELLSALFEDATLSIFTFRSYSTVCRFCNSDQIGYVPIATYAITIGFIYLTFGTAYLAFGYLLVTLGLVVEAVVVEAVVVEAVVVEAYEVEDLLTMAWCGRWWNNTTISVSGIACDSLLQSLSYGMRSLKIPACLYIVSESTGHGPHLELYNNHDVI